MGGDANIFHYIARSGFVRSVFFRVLSIFIVVSIAVAAVAFFSFTSEISENIIADRHRQLAAVEETISGRMEEITSIAYNIGTDPAFLLEPVAGDGYSGYEMSNTLARYLVGNSFIEHLAYYRLSEPDKIYISSGERSLTEFFMTSFGFDRETAQENIKLIQGTKKTQVSAVTYGSAGNSYFAYLYPLPQPSVNPKAFVLMLIPAKEVAPMLETLLANHSGEVAVFSADGTEIYRVGELDEQIPLDEYVKNGGEEERITSESGTKYVLQKVVSGSNGWSYVSVIKQSDTLSGPANRQLVVIALLLLLLFVAVLAMFASIIMQFKPISNLAETVAEGSPEGGERGAVDERALLSNTIATLQDDSEQKQKFENAYHEAEAANRAKSAFLSNMSHDIRTPMNAVVGMTAIALKHADEPDYVRDCLEKVQTSSRYLLDIINNVLDMSRIESGRFSLSNEVINIPKLVDGLAALMEPGAEAKKLKLGVELGEIEQKFVMGDSVRLTQVFVNILSNAVKFTPEGGEINIGVRQEGEAAGGFGDYVFTFKDNGVGMAPEFVGQVFDTFSRAGGADSARVEGTGLGMVIAKNLVELMGGTITCESEPGRGTAFTVAMHMALAAEDAAREDGGAQASGEGSGADQTADLSGRRILLVEDNAINREIARRILEEAGAEVEEAVNGRQAADTFAGRPAGHFDLILMDLQMPVMNGYEATAAIRSQEREDARTVPIYAMTANTFDEDVRQVRDAGMNGHIGKPYTPETLYAVLKKALAK